MVRLLIFSDTYMPLLALLLYATLWKYIKGKELTVLIYLVFNVLLFGATNVLLLYHIHNMPLYHISSLVELWIVAYYMFEKITGKKFSVQFFVTGIAYTAFFILNLTFWEDWSVFNSNSAGVSSLIILFLCMYYLLKLSKSSEILYFQKLSSFWVTSGLLIYNAVSILVVLSYKYFTYINLPNRGDSLWFVLSAAIIVKFALISTGLLCYKRRPIIHSPFLL